jgi:hypothetical protein
MIKRDHSHSKSFHKFNDNYEWINDNWNFFSFVLFFIIFGKSFLFII